MKTVENHAIRVTVTDEIWDSFHEAAVRHSRMSSQTVEQAQRCAVLSQAMSMLGNLSEHPRVKDQSVSLDNPDVFKRAHDLLTLVHLEKNSRFGYAEIYFHYLNNDYLSPEMADDVANAMAYADGILKSISPESMSAHNMSLIKQDPDDTPTSKCEAPRVSLRAGRMQLQGFTEHAQDPLKTAAAAIELSCNIERQNRKDRAFKANSGWDIEILSKLPDQIGMCSTENIND